jgi:natural product biosynthesis luciferase-like monooxygenase protein
MTPDTPASPSPPRSCVLIGSESLLVQCGSMLQAHGWSVAGVFTDSVPIREWAAAQAIPVWGVAALDAVTAGLSFDWLFSITHLRIVPSVVLDRAREGAVNFHDGPLPRYAGLNAPLWALMSGETSHGITWHRIVAAVDAGELLVQQSFAIGEGDTALSLNARCWEAAVETFPSLLARLFDATTAVVTPSLLDRSTYHRSADRPAGVGLLDPAAGTAQWLRTFRVSDTGRYENPFLVPWVWTGHEALLAQRATPLTMTETQRAMPVGALVSVGSDAVTVRVTDGCIRLDGVQRIDGTAVDVSQALATAGLSVGSTLPSIDGGWVAALDSAVRPAVVRERTWVQRLAGVDPLPAIGVAESSDRQPASAAVSWSGHVDAPSATGAATARERLLAAIALFVARQGQRASGDIGFVTPALDAAAQTAPLLSQTVPVRVEAATTSVSGEAVDVMIAALRAAAGGSGYLRSVHARHPSLMARPVAARRPAVCLADGVDAARVDATLVISLAADGATVTWRAPHGGCTADELARVHRRLQAFLRMAAAEPTRALGQLALMDDSERALLQEWGTGPVVAIDESDTVHAQIARQAARTPDHVALYAGGAALTYAQLLASADRVAVQLVALGVGPDSRVALACTRTADLVVGMLGILRAGGAYVPLDPAYPADRVALMLEDCGATVVVTQQHVADALQLPARRRNADGAPVSLVLVDALAGTSSSSSESLPAVWPPAASGAQLAYVIYTSGSTGRPKGVMVEHRQVVNFFRGMDEQLGTDPGVWLAVTSMSFDISVLELLWTLTRGYTVVLGGAAASAARPASKRMGFSLFYFSADEQEQARDKYRLLMEGARFADANGFDAVWTPERHFHAFGGLYPNPSVTGAAVAAITSRVGIRAGSCVLPLHHPARVAEEWSVVDNISGGRVGISFAAGWQPNDFVFRPENYANAKQAMFRDIEQVQRLWRGETLPFPGPKGQVEVRTLPRPVQPELPVWITTAGNPETFAQAGTFGGNLLTHLLGQTIEELAPKIAAYRAAWRAAGHPGEGCVSLMLHTFVGTDNDAVREIVRAPMTEYLRTSIGLIKQYAGVFPTLRRRPGSDGSDIDFTTLSAEEMDALLAFSFERYSSTSALFGTVETAAAMIDRLREIGVNDVACLIDFGLPTDMVLAHLPHLEALRAHCTAESHAPVSVAAAAAARADDDALAALVARHRVTHLQCTPSMARLLLASDDTREALRGLDVMCVGGEALSPALASELHAVLKGRLCNMYGPTETTIWSSVQQVAAGDAVHLGRPIANTTLQVVDPDTRTILPAGMPGELLIGGAGVVRGYLDRPDLTADRFINTADVTGATARWYRTGDLAQWTAAGTLQFLGRLDHQVKVRGYRIELGEIEAAIAGDTTVQEVVVVAREEVVGDPRLVAYVTVRPGASVTVDAIRMRLQAALPEFMVPSQYVVLADMPRTPNLKIDRKALPAPSAVVAAPSVDAVAPDGDLERRIAAVWCDVLRVPSVGTRDNFFDLGGHSLLVVQVHQRLTASLQLSFPITDLFRYSTVQAIAGHLAKRQAAAAAPPSEAARGEAPRDDIARRAELRRAAAQRHVRPRT